MRADQRRNHMTPIDVADQHDRHVRRMRETHVGNVVRAQIGFRRTARTFDDHEFGFLLQPAEAVERDLQQIAAVACEGSGVARFDPPAANDELSRHVRLRLEQHRIHVDGRWRPARECLQCRGATDLAAAGGDCRVVRHVLRFERTHDFAAIREQPAQPRDQQRLADVRATPLNHQRGHSTAPAANTSASAHSSAQAPR